jgi:hypothetical protein
MSPQGDIIKVARHGKVFHLARVCAFHSFHVRAKHTYRRFGGRTVAPLYERQRCRHGYCLAHCDGYSRRSVLAVPRAFNLEVASRPREAPRRDDLDHYGFFNPTAPADYGPFTPVGANNVTIGSVSPYIAAEGVLSHYFCYYLGWRRDELAFDNDDLLHSQNSFQKWVGANSPEGHCIFPSEGIVLRSAHLTHLWPSFLHGRPPRRHRNCRRPSGGDVAFLSGRRQPDPSTRQIRGLHWAHVTSSVQVARIDPDTGLQFNLGPSRLRSMTVAVR